MEHFYQLGWVLETVNGESGSAYKAEQDGKKLFLKRNSSPFLLALSTEGIVPKLLWTKRIETGEVVTAQDWKNGRELKKEEMSSSRVPELLHKIHSSERLLTMLKKLGMAPMEPSLLLDKVNQTLSTEVIKNKTVRDALVYLETHQPTLSEKDIAVCHGDVNHHNWLLSDQNELFLVDWEGAMIADKAIDLGMMLYTYIDRDSWEEWLSHYGLELDIQLRKRMKWYTLIQTVTMIQWYEDNKRFNDMNRWIIFLDHVRRQDQFI
ncbi:MAG TPA: phosphotransferase family protein [Aliicoccus persicus]|uniref:Phosphotransferase family protein n=1 Tax=Aliicoccus persicus TaxID=930138 RepID=A0A921DXK0_9STAP|nr:phosphotransferase family protein [Aliicoccus persicus]